MMGIQTKSKYKKLPLYEMEAAAQEQSEKPILTDRQIERLAKPLVAMIPLMIEFYKDPKNEEAYRLWYYQKYGQYPED